jgi:hypothetical protein
LSEAERVLIAVVRQTDKAMGLFDGGIVDIVGKGHGAAPADPVPRRVDNLHAITLHDRPPRTPDTASNDIS